MFNEASAEIMLKSFVNPEFLVHSALKCIPLARVFKFADYENYFRLFFLAFADGEFDRSATSFLAADILVRLYFESSQPLE